MMISDGFVRQAELFPPTPAKPASASDSFI
jgi:hypothetical protein